MLIFNPFKTGRRWNVRVFLFALLMTGMGCAKVKADAVYIVRQSYSIKDLPSGAKQVKGWFWMPENRPEQQVLDFKVVEAPASLKITRDPKYGRSWLYAEVAANPEVPMRIITEFTVLRRAVEGMADAAKAGPITEAHRRAYAVELKRDEKHMEITADIQKIADTLTENETNPVFIARKFFDYVISKSDHYSKTGPAPKGLALGDATECLLGKGDTCTDQHALFIALCRARGIPCRLMYGSRLKPENADKDHDPGYRCWPNFFAPGLGWVPLDVSSGDTAVDHPERWFGGLDENRLEWAEGRDFDFEPRSQVRPDLVIRGWVEVDGKPHSGLVRTVNFQRK
ncbi:MAG: transglutaminase domain protein [Verrucomicrobiales bacterium]|nr:transglutaminase domain protein [Verrucomicrobiales bacterium]MDB6130674.1 transglutaminase domain protein [Verrucomicrobiales bacterium]